MRRLLLLSFWLVATGAGLSAPLPSLDQVLASKQDLWGLAAIEQTNGPTLEFFRDLLPPLRYVNADFKYYPIVLSAPGAIVKARLTSNGSAVNARAGLKTWHEVGVPVNFRVGSDKATFGGHFTNLDGPHLEDSWLPLVRIAYRHNEARYKQECFASVDPALSAGGAVFVQFSLSGQQPGAVSAHFEIPKATATNGVLLNTNGQVFACFSRAWRWDEKDRSLSSSLKPNESTVLCLFTRPTTSSSFKVDASLYKKQRALGLTTWRKLLDSGCEFETPEPIVNNAWRTVLSGCFSMLKSNDMNYSSGNAYDRLYQAECGDVVGAIALYGHMSEAASMLPPLLNYTRDALKFHNAGFKLQTLSKYYWLSRDTNFLASTRSLWSAELDKILDGREKESGLFPKESYCGDISTKVYSLHSNGAGWRGLRDFAAVLNEVQPDLPEKLSPSILSQTAAEFRQAIFTAIEKSEFTNVAPHFIPVALYGEEKPCDPLTSTMLGSYWDLMAPYMLGSGMFGTGSPRERAIIEYLHESGGLCMGLIRFHQHSGLFANEDAVDDLYGLRYTLKLLELDQVDRALVSFYGKLVQGMTRDTFVSAEGTGLRPLDEYGRPMYLPPNTSAGAYYLWMLRYLLVQDWDTNDDGKPDTLRLAFATPRHWLQDGKQIKVANSPTDFGPLSYTLTSRLSRGEVIADLKLPTRNLAGHTLLRARLPVGWRVVAANDGRHPFNPDSAGTIDISALHGKARVVFKVARE